MHGRQRVKTSAEKEKEQKESEKSKIIAYSTLKDTVFQKYRNNIFDESALEITAQILSMNPELCSFWNYRRKTLLILEKNKTPEEIQILYNAELKLMEELIPRNSKSYWIWFHRKWVTAKMTTCDWSRELGLCGKLLLRDDRNFHCWNYRRYVVKQSQCSLSDEFDFTTKRIEENFSNYSAWHQRSVLILKIYLPDSKEYSSVLDKEFELIRSAFYTEPADQSAWIYHRWLVTQVCLSLAIEDQKVILKRELEMCNELKSLLQSEEDQSLQKWPIFTSIFIMQKMRGHESEIKDCLDFLVKLDPIHASHYTDLQNK